MNLHELNQLLQDEGVKNDPELLAFYTKMKAELIKKIKARVSELLKTN